MGYLDQQDHQHYIRMKQAHVHTIATETSRLYVRMPLVQPITGEGASKQQELSPSSSKAPQLPLRPPIVHRKSTL